MRREAFLILAVLVTSKAAFQKQIDPPQVCVDNIETKKGESSWI
jgi:hypothetical protein